MVKSKNTVLTSCFDTLILKFSRFKVNLGIVFENFSADIVSAVAETSGASIDEVKFHY